MEIRNHKELIVWQKSMQLAKMIYTITKDFPKEELYGLTNQIRRASVSIPSNIAEGFNRYSNRDYSHFLKISQGSNAEVETQLLLGESFGYLDKETLEPALRLNEEISRMLSVMITKLDARG